jgi:hypothetical protein
MKQHDKDYSPVSGEKPNAGPFLARVISNNDPTYMGILEVELLRQSGTDTTPTSLLQVKYMNPFYGVSNVAFNGKDPNDYNNTQKSYGMWFVPPDVGSMVIVTMINGNPKYAYWMGCVMDENMNFMVPGIAATQQIVDGDGTRQPAAEYNKLVSPSVGDPEQIKKPAHPLAAVLAAQGLDKDDIRGTTSSSARRESPSMVFGISTPGPLDKSSSAKKAQIGKPGSQINAFVSRLGGSTFVMDDGDAAFLRKGKPGETAPQYASVEQGETGGDVGIPHNELVRIRTRTGHQILLHNSEDLIYIANARGTAWIEMTSNGKIDIYAADDISYHTAGNFNVTADKDINLTSTGGNINLSASLAFKATAGGNYEIKAGADGKLTAGGNTNINSAGNHLETAAAIHMNGPGADSASDATKATRIPQVEPWSGHENLHGAALAPSTATDTFMKVRE